MREGRDLDVAVDLAELIARESPAPGLSHLPVAAVDPVPVQGPGRLGLDVYDRQLAEAAVDDGPRALYDLYPLYLVHREPVVLYRGIQKLVIGLAVPKQQHFPLVGGVAPHAEAQVALHVHRELEIRHQLQQVYEVPGA